MNSTLRFLGAARNVTGSRYLLEVDDIRILVDCGLYQERNFKYRNWEEFQVPPQSITAVLLTHAHLDHCGLLPRLVRDGFNGKIYCTSATAEIVRIMLLDSAKLQQEDADFKKARHEKEGRKGPYPEVPLYTTEDAEAVFPLLVPVEYKDTIDLAEGIRATFFDAGHVLGSSMIKVGINHNGESRSIVFSGDIGRWHIPILKDPTLFSEADYVLIESTYGDRTHDSAFNADDDLEKIIKSTFEAGGNIIVPSFALERSQEILYHINKLQVEHRLDEIPVYVDSPMAINITEVFKRHPEMFDREMTRMTNNQTSPFSFQGLHMVKDSTESKAIADKKESLMVIAGSGMCTGGRIKHHLVNTISDPKNTIVFVGYQAIGTLGRQIVDGAKNVRILGHHYPIRARVVQIHSFSAHADRNELFKWLSGLEKPPRRLFVTHGEATAAEHFAQFVREKTGWNVTVPEYGDEAAIS